MVIWPEFPMGQYRANDHPYHAPQFSQMDERDNIYLGIICGSGLGPIADQIDDPICLDYNEIPHLQKIGVDLFANLEIV